MISICWSMRFYYYVMLSSLFTFLLVLDSPSWFEVTAGQKSEENEDEEESESLLLYSYFLQSFLELFRFFLSAFCCVRTSFFMEDSSPLSMLRSSFNFFLLFSARRLSRLAKSFQLFWCSAPASRRSAAFPLSFLSYCSLQLDVELLMYLRSGILFALQSSHPRASPCQLGLRSGSHGTWPSFFREGSDSSFQMQTSSSKLLEPFVVPCLCSQTSEVIQPKLVWHALKINPIGF